LEGLIVIDNLFTRVSSWLKKYRAFLENIFLTVSVIWGMIVVVPPTKTWIPTSIKLGARRKHSRRYLKGYGLGIV